MLKTIDDRQKGKSSLAQTMQLKQHGRAKRQLLTDSSTINHMNRNIGKFTAIPNSDIEMTSLVKSPSAHVMLS